MEYKGWSINKVGGVITHKRYEAYKGDNWHWAFLLRECKELCDIRDNGGEISKLYLKNLYT